MVNTRADELLDAALAECVDNGYRAVGVKEITSRAGVSHGTFYNYFENRRQMLDVLVDREVAVYLDILRRGEAAITRPVTEESLQRHLIEVTAELLTAAQARKESFAFLLLDVAGVDAESLATQIARYREAGRLATAVLATAAADGLIDSSVSLDYAGQVWVSAVVAVLAPVIADGRDVDDVDRAAEIIVDVLLRGVPQPEA